MKAPINQEYEWKLTKLTFQIVEAEKMKPKTSE